MCRAMNAICLFFLLALSGTAGATTIYVPDDYATIQGAIDAAAAGDTVIVRPGTYFENIDFLGKAITVQSEQGPDVTVIDGSRAGSVVTFDSFEGPDSVLSRFTITNGDTTGYGGGIYCYSSPVISENIVTLNTAYWGGGGICCKGNMAAKLSNPVITNNIITRNLSIFGGGGIHLYDNSMIATVTGNEISNNLGTQGGGIYCGYCSCILSSEISNNLINGNRARYGGGICCGDFVLTLFNNTITENEALDAGGGIYCYFGDPHPLTIYDTILWNNTAPGGPEIWVGTSSDPSTLSIRYSDVQGGQASVIVETGCTLIWGDGMIDADPLFFDPGAGDFHLQQDPCQPGVMNPCVDTGDPGSPLLEGTTRTDGVLDAAVNDMGYHYLIPILYVPDNYLTIQDAINSAPGSTISRIIVRPGTYVENIDFLGKPIRLESETGPADTVLDGNQAGSVVTFQCGETEESVLAGFTVTNGSATFGGGILCSSSSPLITDNDITGNSGGTGGGLCCLDSAPSIFLNRFTGNGADSGGAIACDVSDPLLANNIIAGANTADRGGAIHLNASSPVITNNVIHGNAASVEGGGIHCIASSPIVTNTVLWNDSAPTGAEISVASGTPLVTHCDVEGGWPGTGNIDADPQFIDPGGGDFHIPADSPCFNGGDNGAPGLPPKDFEGDSRILYGFVDMGVDEYSLGGETIYVPDYYPTIQEAVDAAVDSDIIVVRPGTYVENIAIEDKAVFLKSESGPLVTTIDGNQAGCVVDFRDGTGDSGLEGFTITNGSGYLGSYGGGIRTSFTSPTIANNIITGNWADREGGGIRAVEHHGMIRNNIVSNNFVSQDPGGYRTLGGGIHISQSTATVSNNLVTGNYARLGNGGGMAVERSSLEITANVVIDNAAFGQYDRSGGGIYCSCYSDMHVVFMNNIIAGNLADLGGGISCEGSGFHSLAHNTIFGNEALLSGGGIYAGASASTRVSATILWGNAAPEGKEITVGQMCKVMHSDVEGGQASVFVGWGNFHWGPDNIDLDPMLVDPGEGDFHLTWNSPCKDFLLDKVPGGPDTDMEGDRRRVDLFDLGADEFHCHLYCLGSNLPGGQVVLGIVGEPGSPVTLGLGSGIQDPPQGGILHLLPPIRQCTLGSIPASGVLRYQAGLPGFWVTGEEYPFQALVDSPTHGMMLTNLVILAVE